MDIRVKGDTKLFASIGDPVMHSISPQIHNSIFSLNSLNNVHIPLKLLRMSWKSILFVLEITLQV